MTFSEDFSLFLENKPGAFYLLGTKKPEGPVRTLHTSTYDYNDNLIATGGYFYLRLVENRLGVSLI